MSLLSFIVIVVLVGILLWAVNAYLPMDPNVKKFLVVAVIVILVLWFLSLIGLLPALNSIRVGQ